MSNNNQQATTESVNNQSIRNLSERDLLLDTAIHQKIKVESFYVSNLLNFLSTDSTLDDESEPVIFDSFCPKCKKESTFKDFYTLYKDSSTIFRPQLDRGNQRFVMKYQVGNLNERVYIKEYVCSRDKSHVYSFYFLFDGENLTKVGQTLSQTAKFSMESKKYTKYFPDIQKELYFSMKLYSDGIGVASILYLRRIFEKLIKMASSKFLLQFPERKAELKDAYMAKKIDILKDELPDFLVENKHMYSILSTAVHELEEELCLNSYPFIKDSILLILDQEIERILMDKKKETLRSELQRLQSYLGRIKSQ